MFAGPQKSPFLDPQKGSFWVTQSYYFGPPKVTPPDGRKRDPFWHGLTGSISRLRGAPERFRSGSPFPASSG